MSILRPAGWLVCAALVLTLLPLNAAADQCPIYCASPAISVGTVDNHGISHGSATIEIKNATNNSFLPDLNYIVDGDNDQDFRVDDPFFGIPTIVYRNQMLKIKTNSHRVPVVLSFYDASGNWLPIPAIFGSNAEFTWPALAMPCIVFYSISSPLSSAQVGQVVVVEPDFDDPDLSNLLLGAADGVINDLCTNAPKRADLAILNLDDGDNSGMVTIEEGQRVRWYNSGSAALTVSLSDGRSVTVPGSGVSLPTQFDTEGLYTYTVSGFGGSGIVQVNGPSVPVPGTSWGSVKAAYGDE